MPFYCSSRFGQQSVGCLSVGFTQTKKQGQGTGPSCRSGSRRYSTLHSKVLFKLSLVLYRYIIYLYCNRFDDFWSTSAIQCAGTLADCVNSRTKTSIHSTILASLRSRQCIGELCLEVPDRSYLFVAIALSSSRSPLSWLTTYIAENQRSVPSRVRWTFQLCSLTIRLNCLSCFMVHTQPFNTEVTSGLRLMLV